MEKNKKSIYEKYIKPIGISFFVLGVGAIITWYVTNENRLYRIEKDVEDKAFSSVDMKAQTETYMQSSYTEGKQIEAMNEMTDRYVEFRVAVDSTMVVYKRFFENMELHNLRDNAILSMVMDCDSLYKIMLKSFNKMEGDIFAEKEFSKSLLRNIKRLKSLENFNGD